MRRLLLIALLAAVTPLMHAQRMASASPRFASGHHQAAHARSFFYPLAFTDPFYSDYLSSTGYPVASQPAVVILQTPLPVSPAPERAPSQALMIELRGGRYVQVSGDKLSGTDPGGQMIDPLPDSAPGEERATFHPVSPRELATAVLVFRDRHREEVSDYTVTDGVLYARSDYYSNGNWNRKIELGSLNLPETIKSNQSRGIRFQLPSAPNEVIVGP